MWANIAKIFGSSDPTGKMTHELNEMLRVTREMAEIIRPHVMENSLTLEERRRVYKMDIQVNRLERSVRKRVITHLSTSRGHINYCLLMMSLVKDAERIGDYLKNVTEVSELGGSAVPEGELRDELNDLIGVAHMLFEKTPTILDSQDTEVAMQAIEEGRAANKRCDQLLVQLAKSDLSASETTSMVLLTRFYKRIGAHLANLLSSIVMPLHKLDYYDEKELEVPEDRR
jgi:phosphate uptake regulator